MNTSAAILAAAIASVSAPALAAQTAPAAGQASPAAQLAVTQPAPTGPQPSAKAAPAILALQSAIAAHDAATIPAKLAAAEAASTTPVDKYWIARVQLNGAIAANDLSAAQTHVDEIAATNVLPASDVADLYGKLGGSFLATKQYDRALGDFQKASALAPNDPHAIMLIAQTRADQGNKAEAASALQRAISLSKASGAKASENIYQAAAGLAYEAKLPTAVALARDWLEAYPSDNAWRNALGIYRNVNNGDRDNLVDISRLSMLTNAMQTPNDYEAFAAQAIDERNFGEAKVAIDAGLAAGKLKASDSGVKELVAATKGQVPTEASLAAAEKAASIPTAYLRVGDRYYAAGNYTKAAALYRQAIAKGVDSSLGNLRLGEALARAGDKAAATAALSAVSGSRSDLAKFWLVYVQTHG